jgi:hypothetical protein
MKQQERRQAEQQLVVVVVGFDWRSSTLGACRRPLLAHAWEGGRDPHEMRMEYGYYFALSNSLLSFLLLLLLRLVDVDWSIWQHTSDCRSGRLPKIPCRKSRIGWMRKHLQQQQAVWWPLPLPLLRDPHLDRCPPSWWR